VQPTYPTIQPPSTGELVPANHPIAEVAKTEQPVEPVAGEAAGGHAPIEEATQEESAQEIASDTKSTAQEDAGKTIESATHHG
jgi:hypothetical protein